MFNLFKRKDWPLTPPEELLIAIGDIHGCYDLLQKLVEEIDDTILTKTDKAVTFIFIGDYGDRGLNTPDVFDYLIALSKQAKCIFIRGNHDQTLLDFIKDPAVGEQWFTYGGRETLGAYGVGLTKLTGGQHDWQDIHRTFTDNFPLSHLNFLKETTYQYEAGDYMFVHAGVNPKRSLKKQRPHELMWIREPFLNHNKKFKKFIIHGHTPNEGPDIQQYRLGIDTGAYATGVLTAVALENAQRRFIYANQRNLIPLTE